MRKKLIIGFLLTCFSLVFGFAFATEPAVVFRQHEIQEGKFWGPYSNLRDLDIIDMDSDEDLDIVAVSADGDKVVLWVNEGNNLFVPRTIQSDFENPKAVSAKDLNGDGYIDIVATSKGWFSDVIGEVAWWENDGYQNFIRHDIDTDLEGAGDMKVVDLDRDGDLDIVVVTFRNRPLVWYENDGNQQYTRRLIAELFQGAYSLDVGDIDSDGDPDIIAGPVFAYYFFWYENDGNQHFTERSIESDCQEIPFVKIDDLDQDGDKDILAVTRENYEAVWFENDGAQNFIKHIVDATFDEPSCIDSSDVDGDGDKDLMGTSAIYNQDVVWWENDGDLNFEKHIIVPYYEQPRTILAVDMNDDGKDDLLVGTGTGAISWWENQPHIGARLEMPSHEFHGGEDCYLQADLYNYSHAGLTQLPFFVILGAYGEYWFYPEWTQEVDYEVVDISPGITEKEIIELFQWPSDVGSASGLYFYSLFLKPDFSDLLGVVEFWEFGWGE